MLNAYHYCVISYNYKTIINECKKTHPCRLDNFCKSVPYFFYYFSTMQYFDGSVLSLTNSKISIS